MSTLIKQNAEETLALSTNILSVIIICSFGCLKVVLVDTKSVNNLLKG